MRRRRTQVRLGGQGVIFLLTHGGGLHGWDLHGGDHHGGALRMSLLGGGILRGTGHLGGGIRRMAARSTFPSTSKG